MADRPGEGAACRDSHSISIDEVAIDEVFKSYNQTQHPGVAVGIAVNGTPRYRKGFGLANMELPLKLGPAMRMRIASVSKHFTALAWLLLCEDGKASLDDTIGTVLPELHPATHAATMRQLMGHISGLRDAHDLCWQFNGTGHSASSEELIAFYHRVSSVNAEPGAAWNYNNGGYLILTAAIERICGKPLEPILNERIFAPIGMHDTALRRFDNDFVPNSATLHMSRADKRFEKSWLGSAFAGEGGIVSTIDDMLRWLAHMDAPSVGTPDTWVSMKTPQKLSGGVSTGYGLGLVLGRYRGVDTLSHAGGVMGGNSVMMKLPQLGLDIVILANRHDVSAPALANKIIDTVCTGLDPLAAVSEVPRAKGVFQSPATGRIVELYGRDGQQMAVIDGEEWPFVRGTDGTLAPPAEWSILKQRITLDGPPEQPSSIQFEYFGAVEDLLPVEPVDPSQTVWVQGRYWSEEARACLTIEPSYGDAGGRSGAQLRASGPFGSILYNLEPITEMVWRARFEGLMPWGGIIRIDDEGRSLNFTTARNNSIQFKRKAVSA